MIRFHPVQSSFPSLAVIYIHDVVGRGLLDTNHYLPQIRIPGPVGSRGTTKSLPSKATVYASSPAAIPRHLAHQPESDGDEYVSEADRDARLA